MEINKILAGVAWICALFSLASLVQMLESLFPFSLRAMWMGVVVSEFLIGFILWTVGDDIENVKNSVRDAKKKINLIDSRTRRMSDDEWFNKLEARLSQLERKRK